MKRALTDSTLLKHIEVVKNNFEAINHRFPKLYLAAEAINNIFDQMFVSDLKLKASILWQDQSRMMLFGAYESWIYAYIFTSGGLNDIGLMSLRRAIEFVCYISKIYESDDRTKIWMEQTSDVDSRKKFSNHFTIPRGYLTKKREFLKFLLVVFEHASNYGSHANADMLSMKWVESENATKLIMTFHDEEKDIPRSLGFIMLSGFRIIEALDHILEKYLKRSANYVDLYTNLAKMVREARLELAGVEYNGNIPRDIAFSIHDDNKSAMEEYFAKRKASIEKRQV